MKKKISQVVGSILAVILFSSSFSASLIQARSMEPLEKEEDQYSGMTIEELMADEEYVRTRSQALMEYFEIDEQMIQDIRNSVYQLIDDGSIYLGTDNYVAINELYLESLSEEQQSFIIKIVQSFNKMVELDIIQLEQIYSSNYLSEDHRTGEASLRNYRIKAVSFMDLIQDSEKMEAVNEINSQIVDAIENINGNDETQSISYSSRNSTLPILNVGAIVNENKLRIRDLHIYYLSLYNNSTSAFVAVALDWVSLVKTDGEWDYKVDLGWDTMYDCYLGIPSNFYQQNMTGEYIGNYNYGYTGFLLFPYSVLIAGSVYADNFDIAHDRDDWPAIKHGFDDSKKYGYK